MWLQTLLFQEFIFWLDYWTTWGITLVFMGLAKKTWDTWMLSLSSATWPNFGEDATGSPAFCREEKMQFRRHRPQKKTRNLWNCGDLIAAYTSSECHFDSRRKMSREPRPSFVYWEYASMTYCNIWVVQDTWLFVLYSVIFCFGKCICTCTHTHIYI